MVYQNKTTTKSETASQKCTSCGIHTLLLNQIRLQIPLSPFHLLLDRMLKDLCSLYSHSQSPAVLWAQELLISMQNLGTKINSVSQNTYCHCVVYYSLISANCTLTNTGRLRATPWANFKHWWIHREMCFSFLILLTCSLFFISSQRTCIPLFSTAHFSQLLFQAKPRGLI